jgi:hypothetical protein
MRTADPIDSYLRELRSELRVSRWARRRIVLEARAHLLEAVEVERTRGLDEAEAAARALARFGLAGETARQFDGVSSKRTVLLRRALAPWVAALAVTSMASATVWAFQPGSPADRPGVRAPAIHAGAVRGGAVGGGAVRGGAAHVAAGSARKSTRAHRLAHTIPRRPSGKAHTR